jgi:hypothetical protein
MLPRSSGSSSPPRATKTENLRLDEPAFRTTIASATVGRSSLGSGEGVVVQNPSHRARDIHARRVQLIGGGWAHGAEHHSFTGVRMGAPLAFSSTTTNLAGAVALALRPTT